MKENKLSHIVGMKVWDYLLEIIAQNIANNIGNLGILKPTADLSMIELSINIMTWDRRLKNRSIHDRLGKRVVDQNWADYEEEEYVW